MQFQGLVGENNVTQCHRVTRWSVVQTETGREFAVVSALSRRETTTYCPLTRIHGKTVPLFPAYVSAKVGPQWSVIRWTTGVVRVLMAGDRPAILPDAEIERIKASERGGLVQLLKPGDPVRITDGAFAGRLAIYQGMSASDRERVLLDLLGQFV